MSNARDLARVDVNASGEIAAANLGNSVPSPTGTGASGTWNIDVSGTAANLSNGSWTTSVSGTYLYFAYGGVNVMRLDSSGNLVVIGNVTAYGTL